MSKEIREMVIFAQQNIIMDPPFTKLDILSCRNLLIYLTPELQKKLLPLFHYSLNPGGILFLGNSETVGGFTDLFAALDEKHASIGGWKRVWRSGRLISRFCLLRRDRARQRRRRNQPPTCSHWQINCSCRPIRQPPY